MKHTKQTSEQNKRKNSQNYHVNCSNNWQTKNSKKSASKDKHHIMINFRICDNAKECNGIEACPVKAIRWDKNKKSLITDNKLCIGCKKCVKACMVDAIKIASTENERKKIQLKYEKDPRTLSDLFVDRYGAQPIHPAFQIKKDKFRLEVIESESLTIAEFYTEDSIMCLLKSIPIKSILPKIKNKQKLKNNKNNNTQKKNTTENKKEIPPLKYRKILIEDDFFKNYTTHYPSLIFFWHGNIVGKIEGFYNNKEKEKLKEKIEKIIMKVSSIIDKKMHQET